MIEDIATKEASLRAFAYIMCAIDLALLIIMLKLRALDKKGGE